MITSLLITEKDFASADNASISKLTAYILVPFQKKPETDKDEPQQDIKKTKSGSN